MGYRIMGRAHAAALWARTRLAGLPEALLRTVEVFERPAGMSAERDEIG